ncbi:MAG: S-layer homology domain-containing protein, partial [Chloroflexota bacterium]|nr:S-layer homology domain-containing protein [Chloroflexota bacterium]
IVSNAAEYSDEVPATQQSFADVPHNSPFWLYVERLKLNGSVISGYACGGAGEPCPGAYFRPQNNASRGQVAKIVSKTFLTNCYVP